MLQDLKLITKEQDKLNKVKDNYYRSGLEVDRANKNLEDMISKEKHFSGSIGYYNDVESHRVAGITFFILKYSKVCGNKAKYEQK